MAGRWIPVRTTVWEKLIHLESDGNDDQKAKHIKLENVKRAGSSRETEQERTNKGIKKNNHR